MQTAGRDAGALLKKYSNVQVTAVDYSPLSVEKAKEYNKNMIYEESFRYF